MSALILMLLMPFEASAKLHHVAINGVKFQIENLQIEAGDTVEWENKDIVPHTVTATDGSFDSKQMSPGAKFKTRFSKPGDFAYKCNFHPNMTATVTVKAKQK